MHLLGNALKEKAVRDEADPRRMLFVRSRLLLRICSCEAMVAEQIKEVRK